MPDEPEVLGLQALMRFNLARTEARFDKDGGIVLLRDQDRSKWDRRRIEETFAIVGRFLAMRRQGPYQLQALIAGAHADASSWEETRWPDILLSYDALLAIADSPVVRLNRAIAERTLQPRELAGLREQLLLTQTYLYVTPGPLLIERALDGFPAPVRALGARCPFFRYDARGGGGYWPDRNEIWLAAGVETY